MKSRFPLAVCCLFTTLLIGVWLGQLLSSPDDKATKRVVVSPLGSDGWQLASGSQSGPSATLDTDGNVEDHTLAELLDQSADDDGNKSGEAASGPDIAYFPEVIVGVGGNSDDRPDNQSATLFQESPAQESTAAPSNKPNLTDEETELWQAELKNLPAGQAEEILELRRQLGSVASESLGMAFPEDADNSENAPRLFPMLAATEASPIPRPMTATKDSAPTQDSAVTLVSDEAVPPVLKQLYTEALANYKENLANARTPGFKRRQIILLNVASAAVSDQTGNHQHAEAVTSQLPKKKRETDFAVDTVAHEATAKDSESTEQPQPVSWLTRLDLRQGELVSTANPLDLAIDGPGWLQVDRDGRPEYIRAGVLGFDENMQLGIQTAGGLLPVQPAVHFPKDGRRIAITESGEIFAINSKEERHAIGHLMAFEFLNGAALKRTEIGTYVETKEVVRTWVTPRSSIRFLQSFLEASNVDPQQEQAALDHHRSVTERMVQTGRRVVSP